MIWQTNNNFLIILYIVNFLIISMIWSQNFDNIFHVEVVFSAQNLSQAAVCNLLQIRFYKPPASKPKYWGEHH